MPTRPTTDDAPDGNTPGETDNFASDIAVAVFFLVWAVVGWTSLLSDQNLFSDLYAGADPGPTLLPIIILGVLSLGGMALAAGAVLSRAKSSSSTDIADLVPSGFRLALALFLSVASFPLFMSSIGYLPTTFLFVLIWAFGLVRRPMRAPFKNGLIAAMAAGLTTLLVYGCFDLLIGVRFP